VCVSVCARGRERQREREGEYVCVCVGVFVLIYSVLLPTLLHARTIGVVLPVVIYNIV